VVINALRALDEMLHAEGGVAINNKVPFRKKSG
jgi:hypothetical protein